LIRKYLNNLSSRLLDAGQRQKVICLYTYFIMGAIALVMTIINILTDVGALTIATAIFTLLCIFDILLAFGTRMTLWVSMALFAIEIMVLFGYFVISGNPAGFSILWFTLIPPISMIFYGKRLGTVYSFLMLGVLIFFLRTDLGWSLLLKEAQEGYGEVFRLRFPVLFVGSIAIAYVLKLIDEIAFTKVIEMQSMFEDIAIHDPLTSVYNREGVKRSLMANDKFTSAQHVGVAMLDVDHFKTINDSHGHDAGDYILQKLASLLESELEAIVCRWGGDEFAFVYADTDVTKEIAENFCKLVSEYEFVFEGERIPVTISMGVYETKYFEPRQISKYISRADRMLYQAKNTGRDKVMYAQNLQEND